MMSAYNCINLKVTYTVLLLNNLWTLINGSPIYNDAPYALVATSLFLRISLHMVEGCTPMDSAISFCFHPLLDKVEI